MYFEIVRPGPIKEELALGIWHGDNAMHKEWCESKILMEKNISYGCVCVSS